MRAIEERIAAAKAAKLAALAVPAMKQLEGAAAVAIEGIKDPAWDGVYRANGTYLGFPLFKMSDTEPSRFLFHHCEHWILTAKLTDNGGWVYRVDANHDGTLPTGERQWEGPKPRIFTKSIATLV